MPWQRAVALTALSAPVVALAHLLATGSTPPWAAIAVTAAVAFVLAPAVPATGALRAALLIGTAQLAGHAAAVLSAGSGDGGCLPALGRGAELGLRLAVPGPDGDCPPGSLGTGSLTRATLAAVVTGVLILAGHALAAAAGGLLVTAAEGCADAVAALRRLARPALPALPRPPVAGRPVRAPGAPPTVRGAVHAPGGLTRRGPPAPPVLPA